MLSFPIRFSKHLSLWILASLLLISCAGGDQGGGLKDQVVNAENSAQLAEQVKKELTFEEVGLLEAYVSRLYPDLPAGQLPSGRSIGEMIDAQRAFVGGDSTEAGAETDQAALASGSENQAAGVGATSPNPVSSQAGDKESTKPTEVAESVSEPAPPPPPTTAVVPDGTTLQIRLAQAISSKTAQAGQSFEAQLENDLRAGDHLVASEGSRVVGKILAAEKSGKVKGKAQLSITIDRIVVGEESYPVNANSLAFEAQSTTKRDAKRIGIATGVGAVVGAIAGGGKGAAIGTAVGAGAGTGVTLATSGEEVEFPVEQLFEFKTRESVEMKILR